METLARPATVHLPTAITDRRASRRLQITWDDGVVSTLPHAWLRARCRCAACTHAVRTGEAIVVEADLILTAIQPITDKGLNLVFSDGHGRGIYPWAYLRELGDEHALSTPSRSMGATP